MPVTGIQRAKSVEVAKKTAKRVKHVPQRTCVGCRETLAKRTLVRVVRTPQGLRVDPTGKIPGRGAYLHDRRSCWERGLKGPLAHALKAELTGQDRELLQAYMVNLPEEEILPEGSLKKEILPEENQNGVPAREQKTVSNGLSVEEPDMKR